MCLRVNVLYFFEKCVGFLGGKQSCKATHNCVQDKMRDEQRVECGNFI